MAEYLYSKFAAGTKTWGGWLKIKQGHTRINNITAHESSCGKVEKFLISCSFVS